jgi:hypothetical protein
MMMVHIMSVVVMPADRHTFRNDFCADCKDRGIIIFIPLHTALNGSKYYKPEN